MSDEIPEVPDFDVRSLTFQTDGSIAIEYVGKTDFKANGLSQQHVLLIPSGSDYEDELGAVTEAVLELLADALDDLGRVPNFDFTIGTEPDNDDDD